MDEEMPDNKFNIEKWFRSTYKKARTGNIVGYTLQYEEHLRTLKSLPLIYNKDGSIHISGCFTCNIPYNDVKKYSKHGDWDDHTFSDNERLLAWRIECLKQRLYGNK